jgi:hypothetical protein
VTPHVSENDVRSTRRVVEDDVEGDVAPDHERNWGMVLWLRTSEGRCSSNAGVRRSVAGGNGNDRTGPSAAAGRPSLGITPIGVDPTSRGSPSIQLCPATFVDLTPDEERHAIEALAELLVPLVIGPLRESADQDAPRDVPPSISER